MINFGSWYIPKFSFLLPCRITSPPTFLTSRPCRTQLHTRAGSSFLHANSLSTRVTDTTSATKLTTAVDNRTCMLLLGGWRTNSSLFSCLQRGFVRNIILFFGTADIVFVHCFLTLKQDIAAGEQLFYDYGDRRSAIVASFPWLGK